MRRGQRGASTIELGLLMPFLLLMMVGVADMGRAFHDYIIVTNAAREGARSMSRLPCKAGDTTQQQALVTAIVSAALTEASDNGMTLTSGNVAIIPHPVSTDCGYTAGGPVTVRVTYNYPTMMGSLIGLPALILRSQTTMIWFGNDS